MTRRQFAVLIGTVTFLQSHCCQAQTINISLNLHYTNSADPGMGGDWTLVAKTDGIHGIAGIDARLSNINIAGAAYQPGIGAVMNSGSPFIGTFGGAIDLVYFQDLSTPASVVPHVGRGLGTPGNLPLDALNDPAWDNAARIATGTFGAVRPAFTSIGAQSTDGNVLASASAPFSVSDAAVTVVVRDAIVGDYNRNGTVDAADYVTWRETLGMVGPGLSADGSGNNVVDEADFNLWRRGFGLSGGAALGLGSGLGATVTVPEPASAVTVLIMLTIGMLFNRRRRSRNNVVRLTTLALLLALGMGAAERADALPRAWIGTDNDWVDNGTVGFWSPADEPDADDEAIFNTANGVNLGSNNEIIALTMSGGIDLNTNGFDLDVNGLVQLSDANTNLFIGGAASLLTADSITINNGANLETDGGTIQINEESGNGLLDINAGGELVGHGTLSMTDAVAANTTLIINDGIINARRSPAFILGPPQVGTLSINAITVDTRIDLDGAGELGAVNVSRNQTLDINIQLADIFNGTIAMAQNSILDMSNSWILGAFATIDVDNGATGGIPAVPAGVATIAGATFSQNSGTITVVDSDGTLKIDAPFTLNGGSFVNNGLVVFNSSTTIANAANMTMPTTSSSLRVEGAHTVTINQANFNMDGANSATNVITVTGDSSLTINIGDYDTDSATNVFDGTVNLDNSTININVTDAEFVMDGVLNSAASGSDQSLWTGDALDIGNDAGALDADVNISGSQPTQFGAQVDFNSDADMNVANGATAHFLAVVNFNSVNGGNNAQFTGGGELIFSAGVNFNEATTLNMVGGTADLDGADSIGDAINIDAPLTINTELMRSFGKNNGGGGTNLLDVNNSINTGSLTVDLDDADDEWTLNAQGVMNLVNDNTEATLLAGSDININGTVNVTGDVRTTARVDFGSTAVVNINTAAQPLRLAGGNNTDNPNTIAGGTISGMGLLGADDGKELRGFGTINTSIDFDAASNLFADNGTLTVNGSIVDVARIGTFDADGVLNVVNPWDTSVASFVTLEGGTLEGGTMTINNGNGVSGEGLITAPLINNVRLRSSDGTLVAQTAGNNNDWDGAAGGGVLTAINVGTLELRDVGAAFGFTGTVEASTSSRVFTNGFALDFNPGSTLNLTSSTYESTSSTDIGGTVTVNAGAESRIKVENNFFLSFETGSSTTLNANLRLENNNIIIEQGATFSGAGALVVLDGSHMVGENLANIGVLLDMQGAFRPGNSEGIGRIDLFDYQQQDSSELFVELTGTALNAFDRLVASGGVVVDGFLSIDIDEVSPGVPFVPALGQTFNIITGNTLTGEFDYADVSGMPAGLAFHIEYLANAVQLQVVNKPIFSADFDDDGDVDQTDLAIWDGAYDLNQLGDADGDNDTDGADLLIWQRQFGSQPGAGSGAVSAVPEPTSLLLWLIASLAAFARRR